jgi:hypothetical protein
MANSIAKAGMLDFQPELKSIKSKNNNESLPTLTPPSSLYIKRTKNAIKTNMQSKIVARLIK